LTKLSISLQFYALAARRKAIRLEVQNYFQHYGIMLATLIVAHHYKANKFTATTAQPA
jgi:hypothetical protein